MIYQLFCIISNITLAVIEIISHDILLIVYLSVNALSVMWIISRVASSRDGVPKLLNPLLFACVEF